MQMVIGIKKYAYCKKKKRIEIVFGKDAKKLKNKHLRVQITEVINNLHYDMN